MINNVMLQNKYYHWYMSIIQNAITQNRVKKFKTHETHHIIPVCLGGADDSSNLVVLTYKEHFVCHHLLTKFTTGEDKSKMIFAFWGMSNRWGRKNAKYKITSRVYSKLKEEVSTLISNNNKGKSYPVSDATRKRISEAVSGEKNYWFGKPAHNRGKKRPGIGGRKKGTGWSAEERAKHEEIRSKPGYYDYYKDPERGKKISNSSKGKAGPAKGKKWYNNGTTEIYDITCPAGFAAGRLSRKQPNKIGLKWYNNGVVNRQFRDGDVEEGFIRGRISKK